MGEATLESDIRSLELKGDDSEGNWLVSLTRSLTSGPTSVTLHGFDIFTFLEGTSQLEDKLIIRLVHLHLEETYIGDKGAVALAKAQHLTNLTALYLRNNHIGYEGAIALAKAQHLTNLTALDLSGNHVGYIGPLILAKAQHLTNLTALYLRNNHIGYQGAIALAKAQHLTNLTDLDLSGNHIWNDGAIALAKAQHLTNFTALDLSSNDVGDRGAIALSEAQNFNKLTDLDLSDNLITDEGVKKILNVSKTLHTINLEYNDQMSAPAPIRNDLEALRKHYGLREKLELKPLTQIRTMLIGVPEVGKSTLFYALKHEPYTFDKGDDERTHGFQHHVDREIAKQIEVRFNEEIITEDLELHFWDLGGQTLQTMLHGLFMRPNSLYILVLNHLSLEDPESVYQWLDQLVSIFPQKENAESKGGGSTVIPVRNPHTQIDTPSINEFETLVKNFPNAERNRPEKLSADRINASLKLRPVVTVDLLPEHQNLDSLKQQIRDSLEGFVLPSYFELHDQLSQIVESWTESYVTKEEFHKRLLAQDEESETSKRVNAIYQEYKQQGEEFTKSTNKRTFIDEALMYLDHCGKLHHMESLGYIILDKDWVQRGLYGLLPPEDPNGLPEAQVFRKQLVTPHPDIGLPGIFTKKQAFDVLDAVIDAEPSSNDLSGLETEALFKILSDDTLSLVMDLSAIFAKDHYFMPVYLEEAQAESEPSSALEIADQFQNGFENSLACYVLQTEYWPPYLIYQHMVFARRPHSHSTERLEYQLALEEPFQPERNHYWLEAVGNSDVKVEVMFFNSQIWCFGHGRTRKDVDVVEELLKQIKEDLDGLLKKQIATMGKITRYIPCPECLKDLSSSPDNDMDDQKLSNIGLFALEEVSKSRGTHSTLRCNKQPSHAPHVEKMLSYFLDTNYPVVGGKTKSQMDKIKAITALQQISENHHLDIGRSTDVNRTINSCDIKAYDGMMDKTIVNIVESWLNNTDSKHKSFRDRFLHIDLIGSNPYERKTVEYPRKREMLARAGNDKKAIAKALVEYEKRALEASKKLSERCMKENKGDIKLGRLMGQTVLYKALIQYCDDSNFQIDWQDIEVKIKNIFPNYQ